MESKINSNVNVQDLNEQIQKLTAERDRMIHIKKAEGVSLVRKIMSEYSLTSSDLGLTETDSSRRKTKRPQTFFDPVSGRDWDGKLEGRGRKPQWIKDAIKAGTIESFRVGVQK